MLDNQEQGQSSVDEAELQSWLIRLIRQVVTKILNATGVLNPHLHGVVDSIQQVPAGSGKYFANVFINGATTAHTNIPVNPDLVSVIKQGTHVIVFKINYSETDLYVAMRKVV